MKYNFLKIISIFFSSSVSNWYYCHPWFFFLWLKIFIETNLSKIYDVKWTLCSTIFRVISWPQFWPFSGRFCKHFWEFFRLIHYLWPLRMQLFYHEYPTKQEWNWVRSSGWNSRLKLQECCVGLALWVDYVVHPTLGWPPQ